MPLDTVKTNRLTLAFDDPGLERQFLDDYADSVRLQVRSSWLVASVAILLLLPLDPTGLPGVYVRVICYGLFVPAALVAVGATFTGRATYRRLGTAANCLAISTVLAIVPLSGLFVSWRIPSWTVTTDPWGFFFGLAAFVILLLVILGGNGLRFFLATAVTSAFSLAYVLTLESAGVRATTFAAILTATATLVGAAGSYRTELFRRRLFVQQRRLAEEHEKLAVERAKTESLLRNVLPAAIAERLKSDPSAIADGFRDVTILFADIVGFTDLSARLSPDGVVAILNRLFTAFDELAEKHGLEKIKTIGDAYMVVGGLPEPRGDHADAVVAMALGMRDAAAAVSVETGYALKVRIGVNTGAVVAGVIGKKKFAYDLWGDAVNTASRMESHGVAGEVQVTEATYEKVKDRFELESRGTIAVKGKGELATWFVRGPKAAPSA